MIMYSIPDGEELILEKDVIVISVSVKPCCKGNFVTLEFDNSKVTGLWSSIVTPLPHAIRAKRFKARGGTVRIYIHEGNRLD